MFNCVEVEGRINAPVNQAIVDSDNGLSPFRRQVIIRTNAGVLSISHKKNIFQLEIQMFAFRKMHMKMQNGVHFVSVSMCKTGLLKCVQIVFI